MKTNKRKPDVLKIGIHFGKCLSRHKYLYLYLYLYPNLYLHLCVCVSLTTMAFGQVHVINWRLFKGNAIGISV